VKLANINGRSTLVLDSGIIDIAGLTVGQDISDRHLQFAAGSQFSLGKSSRRYGPIGP
jgi:hypothetical protein